MKIGEIKPNNENPRLIKEDAFEKLKNSIKEDPQMLEARPLVIDEHNVVLGGNMRLKALQAIGIEDVPVYQVKGWTDEQKRRFIVKDNLSGGEWDYDLLTAQYDAEELSAWGMEGLDKYFIDEPSEKDDEVPEAPVEPKSKLGDLYELGEHRVLCGDSTKIEDVEKLMDGKKANMMFSDPPYLMGFTGNVHGDGTKSHNAKFGAIQNDKMSEEDGKLFIGDFIRTMSQVVNGAFYICFYRLGLHYVFNALHENGLEYKAVIVWDKGNHTLSNSDYMSKYEPIVYGWNGDHKFYGDRSNFDIWNIDRTAKNELHPTMKPLALCEKAIRNSSVTEEIVADLFLGSGSTLIASEKTGRICYGMELDPKYVDVIVQRYVDFTGNENIKLNGEPTQWKKTQ